MEAGRFKVMVNMSSDHAGIAAELKKVEREIYRVVARVDDARQLRGYLEEMRAESAAWCVRNGVDMRGWMERTRKASA